MSHVLFVFYYTSKIKHETYAWNFTVSGFSVDEGTTWEQCTLRKVLVEAAKSGKTSKRVNRRKSQFLINKHKTDLLRFLRGYSSPSQKCSRKSPNHSPRLNSFHRIEVAKDVLPLIPDVQHHRLLSKPKQTHWLDTTESAEWCDKWRPHFERGVFRKKVR